MSNTAASPSDRPDGGAGQPRQGQPAEPAQGQPAEPAQGQPAQKLPAAGHKPHVPVAGNPAAGNSAAGAARPTEKLQVPPAGQPAGTNAGTAAPQGKPAKSKTRPYKSSDDWGVFRAVVIIVGVLVAAVGIFYLVTGTAGVPDAGGGEVNTSLESQFRFFSAMMVGVGAAFIAIAVKFKWANMLWLVCLMVFLGGIGRVLSWAFSGTPHYTMIILMILELAFPPALLVWHRFIAKTSDLKREYSEGNANRGGTASGGGTRG